MPGSSAPLSLLPEDQETLARAPDRMFDGLRDSHLLVTGGTGFVGTWLLTSLAWANRELNLGARATVVSRDPSSFIKREPWARSQEWLDFIVGDVRDFAPPQTRFTHVILGAATADARLAAEEPLMLMDTILRGASQTFRAAVGARSVLVLSSGAVYGLGGEKMNKIPEDFEGHLDRLDPMLAYHEAKRALETMGSAAAAECGFDVKIARLFAFVGPWLPGNRHFAVGNFIQDGLAGRSIVVRGDGSPERSYLYAADMAVWILSILVEGPNARAYNVGSDRAISMATLAELVNREFPAGPGVNVLGGRGTGGGGQRYVPSVDRAAKELGLRQTVTLEDGIGRTVRWLRRQSGRR